MATATEKKTHEPHWVAYRRDRIREVLAQVEGDLAEEEFYTRDMDGQQFDKHLERMLRWYRPVKKQKAKEQ
jgi:hypothetical protein